MSFSLGYSSADDCLSLGAKDRRGREAARHAEDIMFVVRSKATLYPVYRMKPKDAELLCCACHNLRVEHENWRGSTLH